MAHCKPTSSNITCSAPFRPDIEGLRAVAILLVIGGHFAIPGLAAGFVGVDIFFVVSGYLITGILVRESMQQHRINLLRFYANRLRRLFPALAAMLVVSSVAAYWILPETQNLAQSKAAAMAAIWLSNLHFTFADVDYFAAETSTNAFVHTWSLGVEEQFYLLWPLLILLVMHLRNRQRATGNRQQATGNRQQATGNRQQATGNRQQSYGALWVAFIAIAATSLAASLHLAATQPVFAFYQMPTRAWQFAAGGMVWLIAQTTYPSKQSSNLAAVAGALFLIASLLIITPHSTYPGLLALLPTLAAGAWLWAGGSASSVSRVLLSRPLMQWIGGLSYVWYLWHWPVLILGEYLLPVRGNFNNSVGALGLSLLLAIATHHLIENPLRFGKAKRIKPLWQIGVALIAMLLINSQLLRWHTDTLEQLNSSENNSQASRYVRAISDLPFFYADGCDDWFHSDTLKPCSYGAENAPKTAVLLGDSIGAQWFPTLTHMYQADEWKIVVLTKSSCPMVDAPFFYERIGREFSECTRWRKRALAWIAAQKPHVVFLGSTASYPFSDQQLIAGSVRVLQSLSAAAGKVYLIEANPVLGFNGPECLMQRDNLWSQPCTTQHPQDSTYAHVAKLLEAALGAFPNVHWLETTSFVCPDRDCAAERDGIIVFRDAQHLTASFTASAATHFAQQMRKFAGNNNQQN